MLYDPSRHETLLALDWDAGQARATITRIVNATVAAYAPGAYWPKYPRDIEAGDDPAFPCTTLYFGAAGVVWALRYLAQAGGYVAKGTLDVDLDFLKQRNRAWLAHGGVHDAGSYLMGDTPIAMLQQALEPTRVRDDELATLMEGTITNPTRELMWGSPGTLLAASMLHERSGDARWADLFVRIAAQLWSELQWSDEHGCHYWTQQMYGRMTTYLDATATFALDRRHRAGGLPARLRSRARRIPDA